MPVAPDLVIPTHEHDVAESVGLLVEHLVARGVTERPHPGLCDEAHAHRVPNGAGARSAAERGRRALPDEHERTESA